MRFCRALCDFKSQAILLRFEIAGTAIFAIGVSKITEGLRSRAAKRGGFKRGGFPIWARPSFFVLFCPFWDFPDFFWIFPICSGMVRGFSRFVLFLFLGQLRAPTGNSPERVRDTIWTFPEKSGKHPGLETLRFSFSQLEGPFGVSVHGVHRNALLVGQLRTP